MKRALRDGVWEVFMVGFHMMHQGAAKSVFPLTRERGIGTLLMFAVRSMFADPPRIAREMKALADKGLVEKALGETADPLGFLVYEGGAASLTEAAYRYARHDSGADVVLFGTGDSAHLKANVAALLKPPLPRAHRDKLNRLFGHLTGIGLNSHQGARGSALGCLPPRAVLCQAREHADRRDGTCSGARGDRGPAGTPGAIWRR